MFSDCTSLFKHLKDALNVKRKLVQLDNPDNTSLFSLQDNGAAWCSS